MQLVELDTGSGRKDWVNPAHVVRISEAQDNNRGRSSLALTDGKLLTVRGTPGRSPRSSTKGSGPDAGCRRRGRAEPPLAAAPRIADNAPIGTAGLIIRLGLPSAAVVTPGDRGRALPDGE